MTAKYTLTDETKTLPEGIVLHRIKRVSDGAIGGWIEKESNLSHADESWVYGDAQVYGNAQVYGDAPFTQEGKRLVIGNGVPLPLGRAIAKAVCNYLNQWS